jgi:hypothetical protein
VLHPALTYLLLTSALPGRLMTPLVIPTRWQVLLLLLLLLLLLAPVANLRVRPVH